MHHTVLFWAVCPIWSLSPPFACSRREILLFLYTDGLTEASDTSGALFGEARLSAFLNAHAAQAPQTLLTGVKKEVDAFSKGVEQTDDITLLALEFKGGLKTQ